MKKGERNVPELFIDLKILWVKFESLRLIPQCVCEVKCNCDFIKFSSKYNYSEYVI